MSLWVCPKHGLYGGDIFCPQCGDNGRYATFNDDPLLVGDAETKPNEFKGLKKVKPNEL